MLSPQRRLFDHAGHTVQAALATIQGHNPVFMGLSLRRWLHGDDVYANLVIGRHDLGHGGCLGHHQHVRQYDRKGLVANNVSRAPDRVA